MAVNNEEKKEQQQNVFKSEDCSKSGNKQEENLLNIKSDKPKNNEDEKPATNIVDGFTPGTDKTSYKKFSGEQCMVKKTDGEWRKFSVRSLFYFLIF